MYAEISSLLKLSMLPGILFDSVCQFPLNVTFKTNKTKWKFATGPCRLSVYTNQFDHVCLSFVKLLDVLTPTPSRPLMFLTSMSDQQDVWSRRWC